MLQRIDTELLDFVREQALERAGCRKRSGAVALQRIPCASPLDGERLVAQSTRRLRACRRHGM
jgi:hypothetical protein